MITFDEITTKIKQRGYWEIYLRPGADQYEKERFDHVSLKKLLEKHQVRRRGWYYPHWQTDGKLGKICNMNQHVLSSTQWGNHLEAFQFYQSGQFIQYRSFWEDKLSDLYDALPHYDNKILYPEKKFLSSIATLYQLTEIFLFASRFASDGVFGDQVRITITLHNLDNRFLTILDDDKVLGEEYVCNENAKTIEMITTPDELLVDHDKFAIDTTVNILTLFNFCPETLRQSLDTYQKELYDLKW